MTDKELLTAYRKEMHKIQIKNGFTDEQMTSYRQGFMDAIREYEQRIAADVQPVDRWINVKDKLPEVGKVIIVCDKQGGVGAMELLSNGQWYHRGMAWSSEWILYWQPLPEPPKTKKG